MQNYNVSLVSNYKHEKIFNQILWQGTGLYNTCIKKTDHSSLDLRDFRYEPHPKKTYAKQLKYLQASYIDDVSDLTGSIARNYLSTLINGHGKKCGMNQRIMQGIIAQAVDARTRYLKGQNKKPRLKGIRNKLNSFLIQGDMRIEGKYLKIPGIEGLIKFRGNIPDGKLKQVRIMKKASGFYACCTFDSVRNKIAVTDSKLTAMDTGLEPMIAAGTYDKSYFEEIKNPRHFEKQQKLLAQKQRGRNKNKVARKYEQIANQRKDFNHKLSTRLAKENKIIFFSNDNYFPLMKHFGKQYSSLALYQLSCMTENKIKSRSDGFGLFVRVPSRNSTKECSSCHALTGPAGRHNLSVRKWTCACGAHHDRNQNSVVNTSISGARYALDELREQLPEIMIRQLELMVRHGAESETLVQ